MHFGAEGVARAFLCECDFFEWAMRDLNDLPRNDLRDADFPSGAKSGALAEVAELAAHFDPGLADVVEAWPLLHPSARLAVEAVVKASLQSVAIS